MLRTLGRSPPSAVTSYDVRISRSTTTPSISEKPAPMHRRTPPPKGIQVLTGGVWPTNRGGANRSGAGGVSPRAGLGRVDGPPGAPARGGPPPTVARPPRGAP